MTIQNSLLSIGVRLFYAQHHSMCVTVLDEKWFAYQPMEIAG